MFLGVCYLEVFFVGDTIFRFMVLICFEQLTRVIVEQTAIVLVNDLPEIRKTSINCNLPD
ncbi:MAG: hypothetical protein LBH59_11025 [Planctomycetaceae bacterium]|jgi:hypothetical protein|nr:hypothetical protein [Planctomycetaceae bacterium]